MKKKKAAASPDNTSQLEERGREFVRSAPMSARRRTSLGSPSARDRANAPLSLDPSPSPTLSRSKRERQPAHDAETLKEASIFDEGGLEALEESIAPAFVSSPKRPKKPEEAAEEGPAADEEEQSSSASEELKRSKLRAKPQNKPKLSLKPMKRSKSEDELQESGGKTDSQKKKKQTFVPPQPKSSDALRLKAPSSKRSDGAQPQKTKKVTYRGFGKPGEPAPLDRRKTAAALQDARTKRVRIVQFGGGTGANAGDAALTSFLGSRRRAATDLGGGVAQSGALTSEVSNIKAGDPADSDQSEADTASESEEAETTPAVAKAEQESEELLVLGEEEEANTNAPATANNNKSKQLVIITHWHEDHAGDPKTLWQSEPETENIATILGSKGAADTDPKPKLIYGQREPTKVYAGLANTLPRKQVATNGEKLFAWKTKPGKVKKNVPQAGELRVEGRAIRAPDVELKEKKRKGDIKPDVQNTESLGVLTIVDKYGDAKEGAAREKERLFTMVSLGDMDGVKTVGKAQVAQLVKEVKDRYGQEFPIDVVKISHHGSDTNLTVIPAGLISNETTVVISGYTGKASGPLIQAIKGWKAKSVIVLVQNNATITKLNEMGADWKNLKPYITVANNLVMTVDDDGSVNIEATTF